jgi:hypothetical protein
MPLMIAAMRGYPNGSTTMTRDTRPLEKTLSPEEAAASWNERRICDPLVDEYGPQLKLKFDMQNNAKQRNLTKMTAVSRRFTKTPANSRKLPQDRGIAAGAAQAILRTGLTSPDTLLLPAWFNSRTFWVAIRRLSCRERTPWRSGSAGTPRSAFPTEFGLGVVTWV